MTKKPSINFYRRFFGVYLDKFSVKNYPACDKSSIFLRVF